MNRLSRALRVSVVGLVLGFGGTASAAPFTNGGFEFCGSTNQFDVIGGIPGWTVTAGSIDWETNTIGVGWQASEGSCSLDLIGTQGRGAVGQVFDQTPGATYQVYFDLAGNPGTLPINLPVIKPLAVGVNSFPVRNYTFDTTGKTVTNMGWTTKSFAFVNGTGTSGQIYFVSDLGTLGPEDAGAALDNVRILELSSWSGSALNVIDQTGPIPVTLTGVGGLGGSPAEFTYQTPTAVPPAPPPLQTPANSGDFFFETTANTAGNHTINYVYSGYHGTCNANAALEAYVRPGGVGYVALSSLYSKFDPCNGSPPSAGFGVSGRFTFPNLQPNDIYGFQMDASNFDSNGAIGGRLTITWGAEATTTAVQSTLNPAAAGQAFNFIATVTGNNPTGHVTFIQEPEPGAGAVNGRLIQGCQAVPVVPLNATTGTATCSIPAPAGFFLGTRHVLAHYSGDSVNATSVSPDFLQVTNAAPPPLAAPTLFRSIAYTTPSVFAYLIGRADGSPNTSITFTASAAASCTAGALVGGSTIGSVSVLTDNQGFFAVALPSVASGQFVAVQLTAPGASPTSTCIVTSGDNDIWPKALDFGPFSSMQDYIDVPGKARWYKFSIIPGQKVQVTLTGLPADYDIVVFKDILKAFTTQVTPTTTTDLNKLNSEFAPSTFSPSTFSPSTFSPSTFSPDAYAPSTFSPSTFSPSTFSPSTFSPSTFSPSTFSPSTFSPSTFSPSTFSPSTFSPSTFSPSTFSPSTFSPSLITLLQSNTTEIQQAFSSAQTRSIIGVSATPGAVNELVQVNTWNDTGDYYVRVAGRSGAFSTTGKFTLSFTKSGLSCAGVTPLTPFSRPAGSANVNTVILTDSSRVALGTSVPPGISLLTKLANFAARPDIKGAIVDLAADGRVATLKVQADANKGCPYAMNLVAEEIKAIVDSYRASNATNLRYVVIVGNDSAVPFFRYPDETLIGQESNYEPPVLSTSASGASLAQDFVLSQDAYGASTRIAMRSIEFPIPGLAVGRLIETPAEIAGLIDAYTAINGVVNPTTSLVTGYDFLADAANSIKAELQTGIVTPPQTLIAANGIAPQDPTAWTATQLGAALLGPRHDVVFLAGHFSANSALAADFTTQLLTSELAASATDFTNSIVFSAGCHAGYNIVDTDAIEGLTVKLDWAQAFARKKATLIAGTGYQYGDTDFVEYSEKLYVNFARQLRAGTAGQSISVGEALNRAKTDYLAVTQDLRGIHQKALLEATVFGLPMLSVNMPGTRSGTPSGSGVITPTLVPSGPANTLGLHTASLPLTTLVPASTPASPNPAAICMKNAPFDAPNPPTAPVPPGCSVPPGYGSYRAVSWLNGFDGVVSNPAEPVLPLLVANVTPTAAVALRGVGLESAIYTDSVTTPLTGAPTTEIRGVHTSFSSPVLFPMRLWTSNYFGALSSTVGTRLLVTPVQHRAADLSAGTSVRREFSGMTLKLYYSANTTAVALSAAPTIVSTSAVPSGGGIKFAARVVGDPGAAIHDVWVTYTADGGPSGTWTSVHLTQCGAPAPAVCGTTTDTQQWMGDLGSPPVSGKYIVQAVSGVGLVSLDDNLGAYYSFATTPPAAAAATSLALQSPPTSITYGNAPLVTAVLSSGSSGISGAPLTFSVAGTATAATTGAGGIGSANLAKVAPGSYTLVANYPGSSSYLTSTASSPITVTPAPSGFVDDSVTIAPAAYLLAKVGGVPQPQQPLVQELVTFAVSQNGNILKTIPVITDATGRAALPPTGLPVGTYNVTVSFAGSELYLDSSLALGNLQVTTPCPLGEKTKVRWHYSANGSPGEWSGDRQISCADGFVAFTTQATEGVQNLAPGATVKFGYALQLPGNKAHFNAVVANGKAVFPVTCASGATPSANSFTLTIPNQTVLLDSKAWNPTSAREDPLGFQGSGVVPNLCGGGQVRINGGTFSVAVTLN